MGGLYGQFQHFFLKWSATSAGDFSMNCSAVASNYAKITQEILISETDRVVRQYMVFHFRWLSRLLRRSAFYLRAYIANETRSDEQRKELTEYLHNQLDRLETEAK